VSVAVDFDGPTHGYTRGWQGGVIYDPPTPGAVAALRSIMEVEPAFIFTAREDLQAVVRWLREHGLPATADPDDNFRFWNQRGLLLVTNRKLPARAYVDDRALEFTGDWDVVLARLGVIAPPVMPTPWLADAASLVLSLHPRDSYNYCATCHVPDTYDEFERWPCPTLVKLGVTPGAPL
jgi:hypothetical protein